jgi:hypothetical protein
MTAAAIIDVIVVSSIIVSIILYKLYMPEPEKWGPHLWNFFHKMSCKYKNCPTRNDKIIMEKFVRSLPYVLPCSTCSRHFKKNLKEYPLTYMDLKSKTNLINWFINLHNFVNSSLCKCVISKCEALNYISNELLTEPFFELFEIALKFIENDIDDDIEDKKCKEIENFITSSIYFSGKNLCNINFEFHDLHTYHKKKKKLFEQI